MLWAFRDKFQPSTSCFSVDLKPTYELKGRTDACEKLWSEQNGLHNKVFLDCWSFYFWKYLFTIKTTAYEVFNYCYPKTLQLSLKIIILSLKNQWEITGLRKYLAIFCYDSMIGDVALRFRGAWHFLKIICELKLSVIKFEKILRKTTIRIIKISN